MIKKVITISFKLDMFSFDVTNYFYMMLILIRFRFERIFDQQTKQDEIFEHVAQPVIDK